MKSCGQSALYWKDARTIKLLSHIANEKLWEDRCYCYDTVQLRFLFLFFLVPAVESSNYVFKTVIQLVFRSFPASEWPRKAVNYVAAVNEWTWARWKDIHRRIPSLFGCKLWQRWWLLTLHRDSRYVRWNDSFVAIIKVNCGVHWRKSKTWCISMIKRG